MSGGPPATPLLRLLTVAGVLVATLLTVFAGTASAHAALTGSDPKDGAVVATAPKAVTLSFSEQVSLGKKAIRVLAPDNKRVDTGKIADVSTASRASYRIALGPGLANGTYTVAWQAVSADTHPVAGAFTFSVGAPSKTTADVGGQGVGGGLVGVLYGVARYFSYAGFVLLVGGAAFVLVCWPRGASARPLQRLVVRGWVTFTASTLALLLLRSPYTGSGKIADVFDLGGLQEVLGTKEGAALVSRLLLLGAAAIFVAVLFGAYARRGEEGAQEEAEAAREERAEHGEPGPTGGGSGPGAERRDLAFGLGAGGAVVAAGLAATWSLSEHASTGIQTALAMPVDMVHLLAVACWLGGLAALLVSLYRAPSIDAAAVRRFSTLAFCSVVALVASGLYQAWRQIGTFSALTSTSYGRLLMIKVGLVVVVVVIAYFSRRWTARLAAAPVAALAGADGGPDGDAVGDEPVAASQGAGPGTGSASGSASASRSASASGSGSRGGPGSGTNAGSGSGGGKGNTATDGARAAQLARQRTAVATASKKRARDADPARGGLRRSVLAEAGVAVAVLALATVLSDTEPGRTAEAAAKNPTSASAAAVLPKGGPVDLSIPFDTGGPKGKGVVEFYLDPARVGGANLVHIYLNGPDDQPLDVPQVKASLTLKARGIGPLAVTPERFAPGHWAADHVQIPMPGTWQLALTVRTSDIDETTVYKNITIG
ncbi:copper resistance CopC/CopD family protein [Streptomyces sp. NBC_01497]|uniref:copper resistance CopC/CopD family protein n=1 Tax=Streptomyces sp. NBC_01497 TaxID=2903885 RepID=UPI002E377752|nr:copper resistance protein CopC [Streptomyces sp. NBC_01497]